jgi:hypothetical protein
MLSPPLAYTLLLREFRESRHSSRVYILESREYRSSSSTIKLTRGDLKVESSKLAMMA